MSIYYENCYSINAKLLRQRGFFKKDGLTFSDFNFKSNGTDYKLRAVVSMANDPVLVCGFYYNRKLNKVEIRLMAQSYNFGGIGYKFICPITGKSCTKLYIIDGVIASKNHFKLLHISQIRSKRQKDMDKKYGIVSKTLLGKLFSRNGAFCEMKGNVLNGL